MTLAVIVNIWKTNYASLFLSLSVLDKSHDHTNFPRRVIENRLLEYKLPRHWIRYNYSIPLFVFVFTRELVSIARFLLQ